MVLSVFIGLLPGMMEGLKDDASNDDDEIDLKARAVEEFTRCLRDDENNLMVRITSREEGSLAMGHV